ncbi:MAG: hypothetical protein ACYTG1_07995 [Planctomycetota bacterium]|jgi:hypothetical protein
MPRRNTGRGLLATAILLGHAVASPGAVAGPPEPPAAADVTTAWLEVRQWVRTFSDLPDADHGDARIPLGGASAVHVVLRRAGRVAGTGTDSTGDDLMVRRAAGRALGAVLGHESVADLPDDLRGDLGRGLAVELEVAGALVPLLGRTPADLVAPVERGVEGLAVRFRDTLHVRFPSEMLAVNQAGVPERVLVAMLADAGVDPDHLARLVASADVAFYRFGTTHLVQPAPGRSPIAAWRGDVVVPASAVDAAGIRALADGIADHLLRARWPAPDDGAARPLGLMGTYLPHLDEHRPLVAPPVEQALAILALARYASSGVVDADRADAARAAASRLLDDLAAVAPIEDEPRHDAATCAVIAWAALDDGLDVPAGAAAALVEDAMRRVLASFAPGRGFDEATRPHTRALLAAALARRLRAGDERVTAETVRAALEATWASVPEPRAVALLPWIGWAELDLADATGAAPPGADRLRRLLALLDRSRVGPGAGPADLEGGLALTGDGRLEVTAQTTRPAVFIARAVRDPRLVEPGPAGAMLGRHLRTVRFLMQLSVRPEIEWSFRRPERALGGLRAAPWDRSQPVPAQALGLLAAVETLESLHARGTASGPPRQKDRP